jgi:hypothetical protein
MKKLDEFVKCGCGKNKKIEWFLKDKYLAGEYSFCVGLTKCTRCRKVLQHYSGDMDDIQKFINELNEFN